MRKETVSLVERHDGAVVATGSARWRRGSARRQRRRRQGHSAAAAAGTQCAGCTLVEAERLDRLPDPADGAVAAAGQHPQSVDPGEQRQRVTRPALADIPHLRPAASAPTHHHHHTAVEPPAAAAAECRNGSRSAAAVWAKPSGAAEAGQDATSGGFRSAEW